MKNVSILREVLCLVFAAIIFGIIYIIALPAIPGWGFMLTLAIALFFPGLIGVVSSYDCDESTPVSTVELIASIIIIVYMIIAAIGGSSMFHAKTFANSFEIEHHESAKDDVPSFDNVTKVSLMDTESAKKLGDRTLGSLSDYVSQYDVSNDYTTISYQKKVMKVAPLVHGGFLKAMKNDTIPGYVIVDTLTNEAKFVKVEGGIKYSPSAFFGKDLLRHIRSEYKDLLGEYYNFQVDEEGHPYWVVATFDYEVWHSCKVPVGAIIVDAVTGEMSKHKLDKLPEWVEQVVDGDTVTTLYNRHGELQNGFWNLSDEGKTQVTEDYGYVEKNGDIYIYTGVTSVAADESNIGFIMVNSRTGDCRYYPMAGAEEYSAMSASEGVVQNYGYEASFPTLVMYGEIPTYVMVLKDSNGLVKKYAMVNMVNYTIVAVEDTLEDCQDAYVKAMEDAGNDGTVETEAEKKQKTKETITIASIEFVTVKGETVVYVKSVDGKVFKQAFAKNEKLILLEVGQEVEVEYSGELKDITSASFK